uniref:MOB kinase activator 3C isoform X2-like n=1 Tax=Sus scrofa TaxID=9823 RepID=A0A480FKM8_PIG
MRLMRLKKSTTCTAIQSSMFSPGGSLTTLRRSRPDLSDACAFLYSSKRCVPGSKRFRGLNVLSLANTCFKHSAMAGRGRGPGLQEQVLRMPCRGQGHGERGGQDLTRGLDFPTHHFPLTSGLLAKLGRSAWPPDPLHPLRPGSCPIFQPPSLPRPSIRCPSHLALFPLHFHCVSETSGPRLQAGAPRTCCGPFREVAEASCRPARRQGPGGGDLWGPRG